MVEAIDIEIVKNGIRINIQPLVKYEDDEYADNVINVIVELINQCNIDKDYAAEMLNDKLKKR